MTCAPLLSHAQRNLLAQALQSRLLELHRNVAIRLQGMTMAEITAQRLRQEAVVGALQAGHRPCGTTVADRENRELEDVSAALQRVHGLLYGLCTDCEAPISIERLRTEPQATRCSPCESRQEGAALR